MSPRSVTTNGRHVARTHVTEVRESEVHGLGVFALVAFDEGDLIEVCPVLRIPPEQRAHLDETLLYEYYFSWGEDGGGVALGYGGLYNHDGDPNATYVKQFDADQVVIRARRAIAPGEEITFDYGNPA